jgi:hypothetical protein
MAEAYLPVGKLNGVKEEIKSLGGPRKTVKLLLKTKSLEDAYEKGGAGYVMLVERLLDFHDVKKDCLDHPDLDAKQEIPADAKTPKHV